MAGHGAHEGNANMKKLVLGALGVVYGDIGTSPLYAMKECFHGHHLQPTPANVLGILSLIVWTLIVIISVKYLTFVMRADNEGEGGIIALMALIRPKTPSSAFAGSAILVLLGVFGASLLYGDGVITPAISVLSAVEGLTIVTPVFDGWVVPITIAILVGLFSVQSNGTARVGRIFGPIMLLWFLTLGGLGLYNLVAHPAVLQALSPHYGVMFLWNGGAPAYFVLGSVFLVCTGGEALYADMGHFGKTPIRYAWFGLVVPALLLNYFGQGALFLTNPHAAENPFFGLAPRVLVLPLVVLATLATVIASQALISGAFSITRQAVQLGFAPRVPIKHTSSEEIGQIYIGAINWALLVGCIAIVVAFGSSARLAAAYGIAVCTTEVITTILGFVVSLRLWGWSVPVAATVWGLFLTVELSFFGANLSKLGEGGWFPLLLGAVVFALMTTWNQGRALLSERLRDQSITWDIFQRVIAEDKPLRVHGTAVFMTADMERLPPALTRNTAHNKVLHQQVVLTTVQVEEIPHVPPERRATVQELGHGFSRVVVRYGFMDTPNVPRALEECASQGLELVMDETTFFLGRETVLATERPGMAIWREKIFAFLSINAQSATAFYRIPPGQVIEIGAQIEI
jgi:KUP system potassium uptake protein